MAARCFTLLCFFAIIVSSSFAKPRKPLICYYESWSHYRAIKDNITELPEYGCTHIIYTFLGLDETKNEVKYLDPNVDIDKGGIERMVGLKKIYPNLKVTFAIGGWNEGSLKYSQLAASMERRVSFSKSVAKMIEKHDFDGVDIDWEYPTQRGGSPTDKGNFVLLLKEIRYLIGSKKLLTIAAHANAYNTFSTYEVKKIASIVDYVHVMTYDLRGNWDGKADMHTRLFPRLLESSSTSKLNVRDGMRAWSVRGAPESKLIMGFGFYGQTFTLSSPLSSFPGSKTSGPGNKGPISDQPGILFYSEVCQLVENKANGWSVFSDLIAASHYAVKGNQFIGYDDPSDFIYKVKLIESEGYGGAMVWAVGQDDISGSCGSGKRPQLRKLNEYLNGDVPDPVNLPTTPDSGRDDPTELPTESTPTSSTTTKLSSTETWQQETTTEVLTTSSQSETTEFSRIAEDSTETLESTSSSSTTQEEVTLDTTESTTEVSISSESSSIDSDTTITAIELTSADTEKSSDSTTPLELITSTELPLPLSSTIQSVDTTEYTSEDPTSTSKISTIEPTTQKYDSETTLSTVTETQETTLVTSDEPTTSSADLTTSQETTSEIISTEQQSSAESTIESEQTSTVEIPVTSTRKPQPIPKRCEKLTYPTNFSCRKFYICADNQPKKLFLIDCPAGLVFNAPIGVCDWPFRSDPYPPDCPDYY